MSTTDQPAATPGRSGRVTMGDVATAAGVSVATVSKVMNGWYGVAETTSAKVLAVIDELGYERSLAATSLRRKSSGIIGVLVAEFEPYSTELLKGISASLNGTGYELMAHAGRTDQRSRDGWERRSLSRLGQTLFEGAIVVTPSMIITDPPDMPIVAIDPHTGPEGPATVDADNVPGARSAVDHLIALGHRRIGFLGGRSDLRSAQLREQGFRESMSAAGLTPDPALMRVGGYRRDLTESPAREILAGPADLRPTAVFAANDITAIRLMEIATELGLRIPEDLSVVGFDNVPESLHSVPPLTTVAQPLHEMGAAAVRLLLAQLSGEHVERHLRMPTTLIVRASTAPPAQFASSPR